MNFHDSEVISGFFEQNEFERAASIRVADLIVLNGCAVRESAENKVWGLLQSLGGKDCKDKHIWVMGCIAKAHSPEISEKYPFVEKIVGPAELDELRSILDSKRKIWVRDNGIPSLEYFVHSRNFSAFSTYVTIIKGCDNFCSYCIVPFVRGREVSRSSNSIVAEIKDKVKKGFSEFILLGQNVNSYGKNTDKNIDFASLLDLISNINGVRRIRFVTSHPKDICDSLIEVLAKNKNVCRYLHFPLQSGSNKILALMNRGYTYEQYVDTVKKVRAAVSGIELSSDFIVGFPGETDIDFEKTVSAMKEIKFVNSFLFKYSKRKGTAASKLKNEVSAEEKQRRLQVLIDTQKNIAAAVLTKYVGTHQQILCDEYKQKREQYSGRTDSNIVVNFKSNRNVLGKYLNVLITMAHTYSLTGRVKNI